MRVAHVVPVFPPYRGGMGNLAFHQARVLAAAGVKVRVVTPRTAVAAVQPAGAEMLALPPLWAKGNAACLPQTLWRVRSCDLIHLHYPFFGTAELVAARRSLGGPPIVLQYHMDVLGDRWRASLFAAYRRLVLPLLIRMASAIVVTSLDYARASFLAHWLDALEERLCTIPAGVDLQYLSPAGARAALPPPERRPRLFFLATLDRAHYFKGLSILLEALQHLPDAELIVGGSGELRSEYESQAERLGLAGRVHFAGDIPDARLPDYYRAADLVVFPSVDRTEAFGLVVLEAMACGTAVVASRLPGVRTLIEEGRNGYLAEPGDATDLAAKISTCAANAAALGAHGRRMAEERYSWTVVGERLIELYERVLRRDDGV